MWVCVWVYVCVYERVWVCVQNIPLTFRQLCCSIKICISQYVLLSFARSDDVAVVVALHVTLCLDVLLRVTLLLPYAGSDDVDVAGIAYQGQVPRQDQRTGEVEAFEGLNAKSIIARISRQGQRTGEVENSGG